jgi:DNA modification methylase
MKIDNIKLNETNPRKINEESFEKLKNSIKEDPQMLEVRPLIIDENNMVLGGNMRLRALKDLGYEEVPTTQVKGWTEEQKRRFIVKDNLSGGEWDYDLLTAQYDAEELSAWGMEGLDKYFIDEPSEKDDEGPETPVEPESKLEDLYELGEHRVLCGDSTKIEDVEKLMDGKKADCVVTDPPYNTGMQGKPEDEKARLSHMFNDKIENWEEFLNDVFNNYYSVTKGDCVFYTFIDWRKVADIRNEMEKHMDVKNVIVWDKKVHGLGSDYKSTYELCVVGKKGKPEINNRFGLDYQDIWRLQREMGRNKDHATAKPIELLEKPILHASKVDDIILDLFLGSGSTLIASQKTGRICYGMELDPKYVDVIVQRYVDFTGNENIKLNGEEIIWKKTQ